MKVGDKVKVKRGYAQAADGLYEGCTYEVATTSTDEGMVEVKRIPGADYPPGVKLPAVAKFFAVRFEVVEEPVAAYWPLALDSYLAPTKFPVTIKTSFVDITFDLKAELGPELARAALEALIKAAKE